MNQIYICFVCGEEFHNKSDMKEVMDGNIIGFYCLKCYDDNFASEEELARLEIGL